MFDDFGFDAIICERLTVTLLHFLWQGAFIGVIAAVLSRMLFRASSQLRYTIHLAALVAMCSCLPVTFSVVTVPERVSVTEVPTAEATTFVTAIDGHVSQPSSPILTTDATPILIAPIDSSELADAGVSPHQPISPQKTPAVVMTISGKADPLTERYLRRLAPYVTGIYLAGVVMLLVRLVRCAWLTRRLGRSATPVADTDLIDRLQTQAERLGLRVLPALRWCHEVPVPVVIGVLRPIVLLPEYAAARLTLDQLQAVMAHELAHIRRYDLVVNVLQRVIESLLFFHPAVWWVSRQITNEREQACDELVLTVGLGRAQYADALVRMAELSCQRGQLPVTALATTGSSTTAFKRRVLKVLEIDAAPTLRPSRIAAVMASIVVLFALALPLFLSGSHAGGRTGEDQDIAQVAGQKKMDDERGAWREVDRLKTNIMGAASSWLQHTDHYETYNRGSTPRRTATELAQMRKDLGIENLPQDAELWSVPTEAWPHIGQLGSLTELSIVESDMRGQTRHLAQLKNLRSLRVSNCQLLPGDLADLKSLTNLEELDVMLSIFEEPTTVRQTLVGELSKAEKETFREFLSDPKRQHAVSAAVLTDRAFEQLGSLSRLRVLRLINTVASEQTLANLSRHPRLERLEVGFISYRPESLRVLGQLKELRELAGVPYASTQMLPVTCSLSHLEKLDRGAEDLTDEGTIEVLKLQKLKSLVLWNAQITDVGLLRLAELPRLESLDVRNVKGISTAGVQRFRELRPTCRVTHTDEDLNQTNSVLKSKPVVAKFPGGLEVKLVGVTKNFAPSKEGWKPDGSPIGKIAGWKPEMVISRTAGILSMSAAGEPLPEARDVLYEIRGLKSRPSLIALDLQDKLLDIDSLNGGPVPVPNPYRSRMAFLQKTATESGTFRLALTDEPWGEWQQISPSGQLFNSLNPSSRYRSDYQQVKVLSAGQVLYTVIPPAGTPEDSDRWVDSAVVMEVPADFRERLVCEFRAVNTDGKTWMGISEMHDPEKSTLTFTLDGNVFRETLARFEYRLRPYRHFITFENVSFEPGKKTEPKVSVESIAAQDLSVTLPDGSVLELLGMTTPPIRVKLKDERTWWQANGTQLADPVENPNNLGLGEDRADSRQAFFRLTSRQPGASLSVSIPQKMGWSSSATSYTPLSPNEPSQLDQNFVFGPIGDAETATLEVRVAIAPWTAWKFDLAGKPLDAPEVTGELTKLRNAVEILRAGPSEDGVAIWTRPFSSTSDSGELNIIAIDKAGTVRTSNRSSGDGQEDMNGFGVRPDEFDHFELRVRPFGPTVKFENVSLQPGKKTDAKVSVELIDVAKTSEPPIEQPPAPKADPPRVELIGLTWDRAHKQDTWQPNGQPMPTPNWVQQLPRLHGDDNGKPAPLYLYEVHGLRAKPSFRHRYQPAVISGDDELPEGRPYRMAVLYEDLKPERFHDIIWGEHPAVRITDEPWGPWRTITKEGQFAEPVDPNALYREGYEMVMLHGFRPLTKKPNDPEPAADAVRTGLVLKHPEDYDALYAIEIEAVPSTAGPQLVNVFTNRPVQSFRNTADDGWDVETEWPVDTQKIDHLRYRIRPYRHRFEFQEVAHEQYERPATSAPFKVIYKKLEHDMPKPVAVQTRSLTIQPRDPGQALRFTSDVDRSRTPPELIHTIDGGVRFLLENSPMRINGQLVLRDIELSADRAVLWTAEDDATNVVKDGKFKADSSFQIYLEGNVQARLGEEVVAGSHAFYNFDGQQGTLFGIEPTTNELRDQPPVARADAVRKNVAARFSAAELSKKVVATLRSGLELELLAVTRFRESGKESWTPYGKKFEPAPDWVSQLKIKPLPPGEVSDSANDDFRDFIVRARGFSPEQLALLPFLEKFEAGDSTIGRMQVSTWNQQVQRLRIGIPGEWGPYRVLTVDPKVGPKAKAVEVPAEIPAMFRKVYDTIRPVIEQGQDLTFWQNSPRLNDGRDGDDDVKPGRSTRVVWKGLPTNPDLKYTSLEAVLIDLDGKRQTTHGTTSVQDGQSQWDVDFFPVPFDQVSHVEYRLRPYQHVVTFNNVALHPGVACGPNVVVESLLAVAGNAANPTTSTKLKPDQIADADVEKYVLETLRTPFKVDPHRGSWQYDACEMETFLNLGQIRQRVLAVQALLKAIKTPGELTFDQRRMALRAAVSEAPEDVLALVIKALERPATELVERAPHEELDVVQVMGEDGAKALPALIALLKSKSKVIDDYEFYRPLIVAITKVGPSSSDAMNAVASVWTNATPEEWSGPSGQTLGGLVYETARYGELAKPLGPEFVKLLGSRNNSSAIWGAWALVITGHDSARGFEELLNHVASGTTADRCQAATALAALGSRSLPIVDRLKAFENDPDGQVAKEVREALRRIAQDDRILTHAKVAAKNAAGRKASQEALASLKAEEAQIVEATNQPHFDLRVVDEVTQQPIAGAAVRVRYFVNSWQPNKVTPPQIEDVERQFQTDAQAMFPISFPAEMQGLMLNLQISVEHPDYVIEQNFGAWQVTAEMASNPAKTREKLFPKGIISLKPGFEVSGKILSPDGQPAEGVNLYAAWQMPQYLNMPPHAVTDANGRYKFRVGGFEETYLFIIPIDAVALSIPIQEKYGEHPVVTLEAGTVITGRVLDDQGQPLANIVVQGNGNDSVYTGFSEPMSRVATDAEGRYKLPPMKLPLDVRVGRFGYLGGWSKSGVSAEGAYLPVMLRAPGADASGSIVAQASTLNAQPLVLDFRPVETVTLTARAYSEKGNPTDDENIELFGVVPDPKNTVDQRGPRWRGSFRSVPGQVGLYQLKAPKGLLNASIDLTNSGSNNSQNDWNRAVRDGEKFEGPRTNAGWDVLDRDDDSIVVGTPAAVVERIFPIRFADEFIAELKTRTGQTLSGPQPFLNQALLDEVRANTITFLTASTRTDPLPGMQQAILDSMIRRVTDDNDPSVQFQSYLGFGAHYKGLMWRVWHAMSRPELSRSDLELVEQQRQQIRAIAALLSSKRNRTSAVRRSGSSCLTRGMSRKSMSSICERPGRLS